MFSNKGHILVNIINIMLKVNLRFSCYWKECIIYNEFQKRILMKTTYSPVAELKRMVKPENITPS